MNAAVTKILVVGGNGFIGSAVCKAALARGLQVTSVSSSGQPYRTPKGHTPAWASKVDWQKGNALEPKTFSHLFSDVGGVVHTLGTLIEDSRYKQAIKEGDILGLVKSLSQVAGLGATKNPLEIETNSEKKGSYEMMNRDTALKVCEAFMSSTPSGDSTSGFCNVPRPFVYISAEDIFYPAIPARYIETKREAEWRIEEMMNDRPGYRGVYIRPSLVYHAHLRPLTTPAAVLFDLSATVHAKLPRTFPTPAWFLRSAGQVFSQTPSSPPTGHKTNALDSIANALTIPPIHVDTVAEAICVALDSANGVRGVVDVRKMRELIGWTESPHGRLWQAPV